jgi:hypothetical protein
VYVCTYVCIEFPFRSFAGGFDVRPFTTASRTALGPTQPPIQWVPGALSLGVKRPGVKLTTHLHLVPRSRMRGAIPPLLQYVFMARCLDPGVTLSYLLEVSNLPRQFLYQGEHLHCIALGTLMLSFRMRELGFNARASRYFKLIVQ